MSCARNPQRAQLSAKRAVQIVATCSASIGCWRVPPVSFESATKVGWSTSCYTCPAREWVADLRTHVCMTVHAATCIICPNVDASPACGGLLACCRCVFPLLVIFEFIDRQGSRVFLMSCRE